MYKDQYTKAAQQAYCGYIQEIILRPEENPDENIILRPEENPDENKGNKIFWTYMKHCKQDSSGMAPSNRINTVLRQAGG